MSADNTEKKNEKKEKPKRSLLKNAGFFIRAMIEYDKSIPVLFMIMTVTEAVIPYLGILLPKYALDILEGKELFAGVSCVNSLLILLGGFAVVSTLLVTVAQYCNSVYWPKTNAIQYHLYTKLERKIMRMDYIHAEDPKVHDRVKKAKETVEGGVWGLLGTISWASSVVLTLIGYAAIIISLNPLIFLYLVFNVTANFFTLRNARKYEYKHRDEISAVNRKLDYIMQKVSDFACGKEMRLYKLSNWLGKRHYDLGTERNKWFIKVRLRFYTVNLVEGVVTLIRDGIAYGYLVYRCLHGMSIADFTMYFATITAFSKLMITIPHAYSNIAQAAMYVDDMQDFLEMPDVVDRPAEKTLPAGAELPCGIRFENVSFKYPGSETYTLKNFCLDIAPGGRIAVVGANGTGKTTFVKLLCGLYEPETGRILVNGEELPKYNRAEYFTLFSVVFQEIKLLAFTLAENVALCPEEKIDYGRVDEALEMAGLSEKVASLEKGVKTSILKALDDHGIEPSGGESQKIALARALYKNASIVILDEPTAALDAIAEYNVYKQFVSLSKDKTAIYISHRLSSTRFCDTVAFFEDGRVAEIGTHSELMKKNGRYAEMFNTQAYYYTHDKNGKEEVGAYAVSES